MSTKKLAAIRDQIAALQDARAEVADSPLARIEAEARVDAVLNAIQTDPITGPSPAGLRDGSFDTFEALNMLARPGFKIALFRSEIKAYLLQIFDAEAGDTTGLPMAQRRQRLAEIDGKLYELEADEERTIEALEDQGGDVVRRVDANPNAQLGLAPPREAA